MRGTDVQILLDKEYYEPDSYIEGSVNLKTRHPLQISEIRLQFKKHQKIRISEIDYKEQKNHEKENKECVIYEYDFLLFENRDQYEEMSSGHHVFPFKFKLKKSDNSSSNIKGIYFDHFISIDSTYTLSCYINIFGIFKPIFFVEKDVQVIDRIIAAKNFETKVEISSFSCFFYDKYRIFFELSKDFFFSGDCLLLKASSDKKIIRNIESNLYEILSVSDTVRSRFIVGGEAILQEDGSFTLSLRIPSSTSSTTTETDFNLKTVLFINLYFERGNPMRIKKYIQIVKRKLYIPESKEMVSILEGDVYEEKIFTLTSKGEGERID